MNAKFCAQKQLGVLSGYSLSGGVGVTSVPGFLPIAAVVALTLMTLIFLLSIHSTNLYQANPQKTLKLGRSRSQRNNSRIIISHRNNDRPPNTVCDLCERPRKSASREWLIYSFT
jgi:hypothetical protein